MKDFKLDENPKIPSGFKTPDGYFDSLPEKVMMRLQEQETVKVIPIFARRKTWIAAAAALLILALSIPFLWNEPKTTTLDDAAIENYISYQANISQYDLVNLLDDSDIDQMESDLPIEDETIEDILISNTNFENYIID